MLDELTSRVTTALQSNDPTEMKAALERANPTLVLRLFDDLTSGLTADKPFLFRNAIVMCIGRCVEHKRELIEKAIKWIEETLRSQSEGREPKDHVQRAEAAHLLGCIHGFNDFISANKLQSLGQLFIDRAIDPDEDISVRCHCIQSLGKIDYQAAKEALVELRREFPGPTPDDDLESDESDDQSEDTELVSALDIAINLLNREYGIAQPLSGISGPSADRSNLDTIYGKEVLQLIGRLADKNFTTTDAPKTEEFQVNDSLLATIKTVEQSGDVIISISIARMSAVEAAEEKRLCDLSNLQFSLITDGVEIPGSEMHPEDLIILEGAANSEYTLRVEFRASDLRHDHENLERFLGEVAEIKLGLQLLADLSIQATDEDNKPLVEQTFNTKVWLGNLFNHMLHEWYLDDKYQALLEQLRIPNKPSNWTRTEFDKLSDISISPYAIRAGEIMVSQGFHTLMNATEIAQLFEGQSRKIRSEVASLLCSHLQRELRSPESDRLDPWANLALEGRICDAFNL